MTASPLAAAEWNGRELAALLAPTLGREKSEELVGTAARHLGFPTDVLARHEAAQILELLSQETGIVGATARFARLKLDARRPGGSRASATRPAPVNDEARPITTTVPITHRDAPSPPSSRVVQTHIPLSEIIALLAATLGQEKSAETVATAARTIRISDEVLTQEQAIALFDLLIGTPGIIGVTARFAKVRMMLRFQFG